MKTNAAQLEKLRSTLSELYQAFGTGLYADLDQVVDLISAIDYFADDIDDFNEFNEIHRENLKILANSIHALKRFSIQARKNSAAIENLIDIANLEICKYNRSLSFDGDTGTHTPPMKGDPLLIPDDTNANKIKGYCAELNKVLMRYLTPRETTALIGIIEGWISDLSHTRSCQGLHDARYHLYCRYWM